MSGFGGGFSGFGSSNNQQQQQGSGFAGFGNTNNPTTGAFGQTSNTGGFGASTSTTNNNPFGGSTGSTFGGSTGGFGANANPGGSLFGAAKPTPFGSTPASTGAGGLFGNNNNTTTASGGFGGFGNTNNTTTGGAFGSTSNTGSGGLFGQTQNKNPFSSPATTGSSIFGGGSGGSGGAFGASSTPQTGFGTSAALSQPVPPSEGTAAVPFSAFTEKDSGAASITNHFQSITFQPPYLKYSFEELRLADYVAGRRYGNGNGQAGAFGANSTFGGFGSQQSTSTGGFGATGSNMSGNFGASAPFGQTPTSGAFGSTNPNPLFNNKPAGTGGLFGPQSSSTPQTNLFGTSNNSTGGFGSSGGAFGSTNTTGGLFGNSQQQQQQPPKPLFGNSGTSNSAFGGFGSTNTAASSGGGGLFGSTPATTTPFGTQQPQANPSNPFGAFGQQNQNQNQQKPLFGATNNQTQPSGGLFGSTNTSNNTGGGLFGSTNQQPPAGGGLFGNNNQQQQQQNAGGLFGNNNANSQPKPSLFGNTNTTNTGGGLFGSNNQQQGTGGLFGSTNNQQQPQQQGGGLFGNTNNNNNGGGLFGGLNANKPAAGGSIFGNNQPAQQQQGSSLFGNNSLLGNSQQQNQQNQQQPQALHTSVLDANPYGTASIWSGLPAPTPQNSGPLATPLRTRQKQDQQATMGHRSPLLLSQPSKLTTPNRPNGYGFSYSTYGTPSSTSSTPGGMRSSLLGSGFMGGSFGRSVNKSFSASNLRSRFDNDRESILSPGAFSAGSSRYANGSIKRLTIDRSIKNDLFSRPALPPQATNGEDASQAPNKLKKRVSFEQNGTNGPNGNLDGKNGALVPTEEQSDEPTPEELRALRSRGLRDSNGSRPSSSSGGAVQPPEMEQVRGNELAIVPEDREAEMTNSGTQSSVPNPPSTDPQPGEYWMRPSRAQLNKMSRQELSHVEGLTVGRTSCGQVKFDQPVDLTTVPLDDICGKIVKVFMRTLTVYDDPSKKPQRGRGLNVPSTISLENSWPRKRGSATNLSDTNGPVYEKHIKRLKSLKDVEFVKYDTMTGVWTFRVPHFTTYGLDYDEDEETNLGDSQMSAAPDSTTSANPFMSGALSESESAMAIDESEHEDSTFQEDDTFGYKKVLPGAFGRQAVYDEGDEYEDKHDLGNGHGQEVGSFLGDGSAGLASDEEMDDQDEESPKSYQSEDESSGDEGLDMAGSFPAPERTVEHSFSPIKPGLNKSLRLGTPGKALIDLSGDWSDELRRTISPRKQDRETLREMQDKVLIDRDDDTPTAKRSVQGKEIANSIDLMQSLFGRYEEKRRSTGKKQNATEKGFEWPYSKRPKTFTGEESNMTEADQGFHNCLKPSWTPTGSLVSVRGAMTAPGSAEPWSWNSSRLVSSEHRDIGRLHLVGDAKAHAAVSASIDHADIVDNDGVPYAKTKQLDFQSFAVESQSFPEKTRTEEIVWAIAKILFDDYEDNFSEGIPEIQRSDFAQRIKKDRLSTYWSDMIAATTEFQQVFDSAGADPTDSALSALAAGRYPAAVFALQRDGNYHLATLVAQIDKADKPFRDEIKAQIQSWDKQNMLSEMPENVRAIYEILAGNTTIPTSRETGPLEDRASKFTISKRFGMNWMQAFGLSLWYAIYEDDPIEAAVADFQAKLGSGDEVTFPYPYTWTPEMSEMGEDPLWVLLKLYSAMKRAQDSKKHNKSGNTPPSLPQDLLPASAGGAPFDHRFVFQLYHALAARVPTLKTDSESADRLALDFAFQLSTTDDIVGAVFALLHLTDPSVRETAIKDLFTRHAARLQEPPSSVNGQTQPSLLWTTIVQRLKIPEAWLFQAKALYAKAVGNNLKEVDYLLRASENDSAHESFCRTVAPRLILDRDYETLRATLDPFLMVKLPAETFYNWDKGGAVYEDFLEIVQPTTKHGTAKAGKEYKNRLTRLHGALVKLGGHLKGDKVSGLEERVAIKEISRMVAEWLADEKEGFPASSILDLPLTQDARLAHTLQMSTTYYRALMTSAK